MLQRQSSDCETAADAASECLLYHHRRAVPQQQVTQLARISADNVAAHGSLYELGTQAEVAPPAVCTISVHMHTRLHEAHRLPHLRLRECHPLYIEIGFMRPRMCRGIAAR